MHTAYLRVARGSVSVNQTCNKLHWPEQQEGQHASYAIPGIGIELRHIPYVVHDGVVEQDLQHTQVTSRYASHQRMGSQAGNSLAEDAVCLQCQLQL